MGERRWSRRVSKVGRISLYNRDYPVGRRYARQDVHVRFDPIQRQWVIRNEAGEEIARHSAEELAPERIESLSVSHKKSLPSQGD
jgi:hypothetical protein